MTKQTSTGRRVEYVRLDELRPAPRNPKQHDGEGIARSIHHFGLAELPLVDERTGLLVAGHGRLDELRAMRANGKATPPDGLRVDSDGMWLIPVIRGWASRSDADAEAYLVASNNLVTRGGWDMPELTSLLQGLAEVDADLAGLTGWDVDDIADMVKMLEPPDLGGLGGKLGDPEPSDSWPVVRVKVPPHVAAAWRSHVEVHDDDELVAFAALLEVDPDAPPPSTWTP